MTPSEVTVAPERPSTRYGASVDPGESRDLDYELVFKRGYNEKQDNVTLAP